MDVKPVCDKGRLPLANRFGRWNWAAIEGEVARNQVLNRAAIENLGYTPWRVGLARNKFERFEALLDSVFWWVIGILLPLAIQWPLTRKVNRSLTRRFQLTKAQPVHIGLDRLDWSVFQSRQARQQLAEELGLKQLGQLKPLMKSLVKTKLGIIFIDVGLISLKQQLYFWGRNMLIEKWSKKKGFSGEFKTATAEQLQANAQAIEKSEGLRKQISKWAAIVNPFMLPLGLLAIMTRKAPVGTGIAGKLKKLLPFFNYHQAIYMTKWIQVWTGILGWNLTGFLAARDNHERRESLVRSFVADFFYFIGDDIFAGIAGRYFQRKHKAVLGQVQLYKRGWFGIPWGNALDDIVKAAQQTGNPKVVQLADKLGRWNFRIGLLTTAGFLGIGLTLLNNWFTKKKVLAEQKNNAHAKTTTQNMVRPALTISMSTRPPYGLQQRAVFWPTSPVSTMRPTYQTVSWPVFNVPGNPMVVGNIFPIGAKFWSGLPIENVQPPLGVKEGVLPHALAGRGY